MCVEQHICHSWWLWSRSRGSPGDQPKNDILLLHHSILPSSPPPPPRPHPRRSCHGYSATLLRDNVPAARFVKSHFIFPPCVGAAVMGSSRLRQPQPRLARCPAGPPRQTASTQAQVEFSLFTPFRVLMGCQPEGEMRK